MDRPERSGPVMAPGVVFLRAHLAAATLGQVACAEEYLTIIVNHLTLCRRLHDIVRSTSSQWQ